MRFRLMAVPVLVVSIFAIAAPAFSQVVPAYQRKAWPFSIGIGPSSYDVDWGHGRMMGGTAWIDYYPGFLPHILHGLGVEGEVRDISIGRSSTQTNLREDTAGIGPIYTWRRFQNFQPYAKFLIADGSIDFPPASPSYSHDTRTLTAPGGGFEYRFYGQFWARADYEYQSWQKLFGKILDPQGFTVGVAYDFAHPRPPKQ